jgi:hypothetical protein
VEKSQPESTHIYTQSAEQEIENFAARVQKSFRLSALMRLSFWANPLCFLFAPLTQAHLHSQKYILCAVLSGVCAGNAFSVRAKVIIIWTVHGYTLARSHSPIIITERCKGGSKIFTNDDYLSTSSTICFPPEITGLLF